MAVPASEAVTVPAGETPWGTATIIYNDIPLVAGKNDYEGTEGNDNFMGVVGGVKRLSRKTPTLMAAKDTTSSVLT